MADSWEKQLERLKQGPPELSEGQKTAMEVEAQRAEMQRIPRRSLDDIVNRVIEARKIGVAPDDPDAAWADARNDVLKFKLAEAQRRYEAEDRREQEQRIEQEARRLAEREAMIETRFGLSAPMRRVAGDTINYNYPTPKKPVEIPILTFGKRRINLKDVA